MDRYANGTRVRVRVVPLSRDPYSDVWLYENVEGRVLNSNTVSAFQSRMCTVDAGPPHQILVNEYSVLLDTGIEINQIPEECLEELMGM